MICKSKSLQPWGHFSNVNQVLFHLQAKNTKMVMLPPGLKKNQYKCIENPGALIRAAIYGETTEKGLAQEIGSRTSCQIFFFFSWGKVAPPYWV